MIITFRHVRVADYRGIKFYITNYDVTKFLTWKPYDDEEKIKFFCNLSVVSNKFPNEFIGIFYQKKIIGTVHLIARRNKKVQFGFGILPRFWGKGFGKQIIKKTISHVRRSVWCRHVESVIADVHKDNIFAIEVLKKNGFTKISRQPKVLAKRLRFIYPL